ncbi:MAG: GNAT family N-acetyltransferase [Lentisphaeria bacterium]|nr:GNAT family N-acetyltransferase [Lentisphaeria bacterium]
MIVVREFQDCDAAGAAEVYYESFKTYLKERMGPKRSAEYWQNSMKRFTTEEYDNISFVALDGDRVVGCISIAAALVRRLGTLTRIGVLPEYAGKGIGKMLFEEADRFWRERKMRKVATCVSSINTAAIKFYERCGFHCEGVLKDHFFPGVDEHQLALFY